MKVSTGKPKGSAGDACVRRLLLFGGVVVFFDQVPLEEGVEAIHYQSTKSIKVKEQRRFDRRPEPSAFDFGRPQYNIVNKILLRAFVAFFA